MFKLKKNQKKQKGQSTVEYIILVAAVIALAIAFAAPQGAFRQALNGTWSDATTEMTTMSNRLSNARPLAP